MQKAVLKIFLKSYILERFVNTNSYSKVNKSTGAKVAVIFDQYRFSVNSLWVVATIKKWFVPKTNSNILNVAITKKKKKINKQNVSGKKITANFSYVNLLTFE
jgi:hypothetical protein